MKDEPSTVETGLGPQGHNCVHKTLLGCCPVTNAGDRKPLFLRRLCPCTAGVSAGSFLSSPSPFFFPEGLYFNTYLETVNGSFQMSQRRLGLGLAALTSHLDS